LWRHQTGWIFSSGYGPIRLWTRAAPPLIRFARRRLRKICRSLCSEHVVPSAFVLKRRIRDVIAPLPTRGVRKEKSHTSRNPTSQPVFDWLDFQSTRNPTSFRLVGFSIAEKSNQFSTGWIFNRREIQPVFDWLDFHPREIQPVFAMGRAYGRARESSMRESRGFFARTSVCVPQGSRAVTKPTFR
jgi:hypothetical protein